MIFSSVKKCVGLLLIRASIKRLLNLCSWKSQSICVTQYMMDNHDILKSLAKFKELITLRCPLMEALTQMFYFFFNLHTGIGHMKANKLLIKMHENKSTLRGTSTF